MTGEIRKFYTETKAIYALVPRLSPLFSKPFTVLHILKEKGVYMMKFTSQDKLTAEEKAERLVNEMSVEEQMSLLRYDSPALERLGIPAYNWWGESLHGVARAGTATMLPQAIALAATFDAPLLEKAARMIGMEVRAKYNEASRRGDRDIYKGLTMWSPNINIFRDPRWGRGQETYGECPYLTSRMGVAFVRGLQGEGEPMLAAACAKHYAAHSGPESIRHGYDAQVEPKDLEETYLPAFKALVQEAHVEGVMGAYNRLNGIPACAQPFLMQKLREWGFSGYFVSDFMALQDIHTAHHSTDCAEQSAALALNAGCDCNAGVVYRELPSAYEKGLVSKQAIRDAALHVMRTRARLGTFDESTRYDALGYDIVACKAHRSIALECARKSMVLLKNDGLLPLAKEKLRSIAVIGPNADSLDALRGNYYGTAARPVTFLEGITAAAGEDIRVYYAQGSHLIKNRINELSQPDDGLAEAAAVAERADVAILCLGLDAMLEGEEGDVGNEFDAGDKRDLLLPLSQRKLLDTVLATGTPVVVVLASGSALNPHADKASAILQAWYPGEAGGEALADILFGRVSPSGKLPVTFYEDSEKLAPFTDYSMKNRTYRFAENNILYPFGFGLSYSTVRIESFSYDAENGTALVRIENTGEREIEEVVQLYIHDDVSPDEVRNPRLCAFGRVRLAPGTCEEFSLSIGEDAFTVVNAQGERIAGSGSYTLWAGVSQPDAHSQALCGCACKSVQLRF